MVQKQKNTGLRLVVIGLLIMAALTAALLALAVAHAKNDTYVDIDPGAVKLVQLDPPSEGDPIAIVDTTLGEFRFVLYPQYSPKAVENFISLAESGYYSNTYVFNSDSGAYSAAGCPQKSGTLPEGADTSRELIPRELSQDLWPFRGAVCSLTTTVDKGFREFLVGGGDYYNGSRFALINSIEFTDEIKEQLSADTTIPDLSAAFLEKGGIPNFSQQMTVIGQTYEGLDVIEALASLEVQSNGVYKVPVDDVMINSVTISEYSAED